MSYKILFVIFVLVLTIFVQQSDAKSQITISTKDSYYLGDTLEISGFADNGIAGDLIALEIKTQKGETIVIRTIELGPGGTFDFQFKIPKSSESGTFQIITTGEIVGESVTTTKSISYSSEPPPATEGGCLIATATFGSELAPQVQKLRELRDNNLVQTNSGLAFMTGFNQIYYSFSPTIADWERQSPVFKEFVKITITPLLTTLSILDVVSIDSEAEVLGYGIGVILLNVGIYFVTPALVLKKLTSRKRWKSFEKQF